ncbi:nucleoside diphosphate kinase [Haematococcus lacustris]
MRSAGSVLKCLRAAAGRAQWAPTGLCVSRAAATSSQALRSGSSAGSLAAAAVCGLALFTGFAHEAMASTCSERTFIAIKPDGVHRGLMAEIMKRFEAKGYKLVGIKLVVPTADLAGAHYAEHNGKPFYPKLVNFLSSGPVLAMVWEGKEAIKYGRSMIGATNPLASAPGTIRGDFGVDVGRNIVHGSDSVESAQREIALWFKPEELAEWNPVASPWIYE